MHYFHKFIFVLRGLLFDKFSRHSIIEIISTIPMENDGIDFTYLRFFAKPSKFIFTKYQISLNLTLYIKLLIPRNIFQEQYRNPTFYIWKHSQIHGVQNGNIYPSRNTACHRIDQQSARRRYRSLSCARRPVTVSKPLVLPGWRVIQSKAGGLGNVSRYKIRKESVGGSSESVIV